MDKITKFLKQLTKKERAYVYRLIEDAAAGRFAPHDVKKLRGYANIYRIRSKDLRIIFTKEDDTVEILYVGRRNEKTYKDF